MNIPNILSGSVVITYILPFILYIVSGKGFHLKAFLGISGTTIISESIKFLFIGKTSPRPQGAKDCDLLCNDGDQSGKPGMPSSHSASVAFFSGFYYQQTNNYYIRTGLIIYAGLVMLSRYLKQCHTISQIIIGGCLGLSLSFIAVRHL